MRDLLRLRKLYQLKNVYRYSSVQGRKESSAEHTWSCLVLADYFLERLDIKLNKEKVHQLLLYHDIVEIEAGDTPIHHHEARKGKQERERKAMQQLEKALPSGFSRRVAQLFQEFEGKKTKEAQFAAIIDQLDAMIHEMDYPEDWKGWTEAMVREFHEQDFQKVPYFRELFEEIITYLKSQKYLR
ncbi:HD domain-containing protein [Candidatus Woesearchaeota archaeon]|nr:HD domain-containing protein [Candidatus Woesearchaeota archaeon]